MLEVSFALNLAPPPLFLFFVGVWWSGMHIFLNLCGIFTDMEYINTKYSVLTHFSGVN